MNYLQSDKADKSGFDILLAKHINGKMVIKDVIEFMKERWKTLNYVALNIISHVCVQGCN